MTRVSLLDPQLKLPLGQGLESSELAVARRILVVDLVTLDRGRWSPPREAPRSRGHLGYLVLNGLALREVCLVDEWSAELLSSGDLLRPWLEDAASFVDARWQILTTVRLAVLDPQLAGRLARWPSLIADLNDSALRRSRSLAVHAALTQLRRVEDRLRLLLWHLAERWGQLEDGAVVISLPLTHELLGRLVAARRPSVTASLSHLVANGELARGRSGGWILSGDPPAACSLS